MLKMKWLSCFIITALIALLARPLAAQTTAPLLSSNSSGGAAVVVVLKADIDEYSQETLIRRMEQAKAAGAKTIILQLKTRGGLVTVAQEITRYLRNQTDVHVIA